LNIKQRFIIPQLAPLFYNFGKIFGVLVLVPLMGGSIWGLVWGSVIGAVLHIVIQYPLLKHLEFKWNFNKINFKDNHLIEAMRLGLPRTFSLAMEQSAVIVDSIIAIGLLYQSLSVYKYAVILIAFPLSFGSSFAIASFPSFSKLKGMGENQQFSDLFMKVINEVIYLTLPISVIFIVLRIPIVRLIYGLLPGGSFSWNDTLRVGWVVLFFSLGITFEALRPVVFRAFFASKDTITTFVSSMFILIGGIVTGIMFSNYFSHFDGFHLGSFIWNWDYFFTRGSGEYGVVGLAASSSLIFTMEFFILIFLLWKKKHIFGLKKFFIGLLYKIVVAIVMMIVCYILAKFWEEILNTAKTLQLFILTATTSIASLSIYLLLSYIFSIEEVKIFIKLINKILQLFRIKVRI
jgi:putative peptidoglycan lipid II flippase